MPEIILIFNMSFIFNTFYNLKVEKVDGFAYKKIKKIRFRWFFPLYFSSLC